MFGGPSTLSTLGSILGAGVGTFASTLLALYLATIVETSAHEFLYDNFPHKYANVPEEELPLCVYDREMTCREARGAEVVNEMDDGSPKLHLLKTTSLWESWMAKERARIMEEEARMFVEMLPAPSSGKELSSQGMMSASKKHRMEEIKNIRQAEVRKFREQLTSLAMTA